MPYVIIRSRKTTVGQQGAITREAPTLITPADVGPVVYPRVEDVYRFTHMRRGTSSSKPTLPAAPPARTRYQNFDALVNSNNAQANSNIAQANSNNAQANSHNSAGESSDWDVVESMRWSGAQSPVMIAVGTEPDVVSVGSATTSKAASPPSVTPLPNFLAASGVGSPSGTLGLSAFLQSTSSMPGAFPLTGSSVRAQRHTATQASPLMPKLTNGIDVAACLFHVGSQKKAFYEQTVAELQTALLGIIPREHKEALAKRFPDVLKKCCGVLGAMAAIYNAKNKEVAKKPNQASKNIATLRDEAATSNDTARRMLRSRSIVVMPRSPGGLTSAISPRNRDRPNSISPDEMATSTLSRGPSAIDSTRHGAARPASQLWSPQQIAQHLLSSSDAVQMGDALVSDGSVVFHSFERAAEDFIRQQELQYQRLGPGATTTGRPRRGSQVVLSPTTTSGYFYGDIADDDAEDEESSRMQALRQQLLLRRVEHLKDKERRERDKLLTANSHAQLPLLQEFASLTRFFVSLAEQAEWKRLRAEETSFALKLAVAYRSNRRGAMQQSVDKLAAEQEADLRADTDRRVADARSEGLASSRCVQRLNLSTEQTVQSSIRQEREARFNELLRHRRANPTTYFPEYDEEEVEGPHVNDFVPMRIATATERERQMAILDAERAAAEASVSRGALTVLP